MKQPGSASQPFVPGLILLAALCLYGLIRAPFTAAESELLARARAPVAELLGSPYSPLYLLLLRLWSSLGEHPVWLRLLPALCGLAALSSTRWWPRTRCCRRAPPPSSSGWVRSRCVSNGPWRKG